MPSNCIFSCNEVKCSSENLYSFQNIICSSHLKEIFGLKLFAFKFETETATEQCGPFLTPEDHYSFPANTVIFPEKAFLDSYLMPEKVCNPNFNYTLNSKLQTYYKNLQMQRCYFKDLKTYKYHYELIRNLFETDYDKITLSNDADTSNIELKTHIQDRISKMNHWIKNEPYYENFKNMTIKSSDTNDITLQTLSPFIGFILYNMLFDKGILLPSTAPLMCYANVTYVNGIGLVTVQQIKNNLPLVVIGNIKNTFPYMQHKTHIEPKQVVLNRVSHKMFPDTNRNLNVLSTNDRYCR